MSNRVRPKKHLGQHFLNDQNIAQKIVDSLDACDTVLEIGPGMGVLTRYLLRKDCQTYVIEVDTESVAYLKQHYPQLEDRVVEGDFLKLDITTLFPSPLAIIGNFPYNISSQILFKVLEHRDHIPQLVGMFQKEVAERVTATPGNKSYGILSVLLQAFYDMEYLFTVHEQVFTPPPAVKSAVIRMRRNQQKQLDCDEALFVRIVKTAFNQRRKTLRNALKSVNLESEISRQEIFSQRAEQLTVAQFVSLTQLVQNHGL